MTAFTSRRQPGMKWPELVEAWLPGIGEEAMTVLWELTAFPLDPPELVERRLSELAEQWDAERRVWRGNPYAEVEVEMEGRDG